MSLGRKAIIACLAGVAAFGGALWGAAAPPFVAGYARLGQPSAEAGEVLLSELSCLACHRDESKLPPGLVWKAGPNVGGIGDRLRPEYLREFLTNPSATKPGTTMPHVLAGQPEAQRAQLAEDLTHFLMQLRGAPEAGAPPKGDAKKGDELYLSAGCVACHSAVPLVRLADKYAPGQLVQFLLNPLEVRPAGRMPNLHLTAQEAADIAAFIAPEPPASKAAAGTFAIDPTKAARGTQAFQSLGCIACHGGVATGKPLAKLDPQSGCLAEIPGGGVPHYPLAAEQRTAIRAALQARAKNPPSEEPKAIAHRLMLQRNCFACHVRDGFGGPAPEIAEHFTCTKDDLGDLGRLPPPLDGVGRKLQQPVLADVLRGQNLVRSYMRVRMGDFGPELSESLSDVFARADTDPNEVPTIAKTNPNAVGRNEAGREAIGMKGFACISCHDLHGHASLGIGGYDLAEIPKRLRPEWVRDFLLNPAAFPTGTRMPAFWPPNKRKATGTAERQIDSIRVYLTEVDQSLPPEGFIDHAAFELKPAERPIVFRTFIEDVGSHAVAVGFPQGVNVAFDARLARWALAWRGKFLDADGTWNMRVARIEKPLGEARIGLENAGTLTIAGSTESPMTYRGYRVGADGVPTFLYDLGALHIEDRIAPNTGNGLRRTLRVTGQTNEAVQFQAQPPAGMSVQVANQATLPVQLQFRQGAAEIAEEITW